MRNYGKIGLLIYLLLITGLRSHAQSDGCRSVLSGQILGQDSGQPLVGATLFVRELKRGAVTDTNGVFRLPAVCSGQYTVDYQYVSYKTTTATITVTADSVQVLPPVQLLSDSKTLQEVVITETPLRSPAIAPDAIQFIGCGPRPDARPVAGREFKIADWYVLHPNRPYHLQAGYSRAVQQPDYYSQQRDSAGRPAVGNRNTPRKLTSS